MQQQQNPSALSLNLSLLWFGKSVFQPVSLCYHNYLFISRKGNTNLSFISHHLLSMEHQYVGVPSLWFGLMWSEYPWCKFMNDLYTQLHANQIASACFISLLQPVVLHQYLGERFLSPSNHYCLHKIWCERLCSRIWDLSSLLDEGFPNLCTTQAVTNCPGRHTAWV